MGWGRIGNSFHILPCYPNGIMIIPFTEIENNEEDLGEMMNLILICIKVIKLIGFNVGY